MQIFLYYIVPFIVVLGVLIFFHELGHFLVAKYFDVKVLKFSLGFGTKVVGTRIGETEYLISSIPLGGYVKMLGESHDDVSELPEEEKARAFNNQHVLKRMAIVLAGPLFNFILAILIFCLFYSYAGEQVILPKVGQVRPNSPAASAGLKKGDLIISVSGNPVESWEEIRGLVQESGGKEIEMVVSRGPEIIVIKVRPEASQIKNIFGETKETYLIGIVASGEIKQVKLESAQAIQRGIDKTWEVTKLTLLTVVKLFQGVVPIKTLGGPILIGQMTGQLAQQDYTYLIPFMAVISINLGILNLLPIPILDGGLIVFLLVELITGRPIGLKKQELAQKVGLAILIGLMAVVMYNDILRILGGGG